MAKVYCAGPLFNEPECREMAKIAATIEAAGHETFLPQRDGLEAPELAARLGPAQVRLHHVAIFSLDVYYLLEWCDIVVANLNGRVPDEGTVVECALAWHAKKPLVIYKNDGRQAPFDGHENPMITGLTGDFVESVDKLVGRLEHELLVKRASQVTTATELGHDISDARKKFQTADELGNELVRLVRGRLGAKGGGP